MKDLSAKHILSDELIAAYLDGNATAEECLLILQAMEHDAQLRERLRVSLTVDAEMGLLLQQSHHLPTMAMAANCQEGSFCCLQCEKFILRRRAICYDEQQLLDNALRNGWLKANGTALHNVGRHLEQAGLSVLQRYDCQLQDIAAALEQGHDVVVAVDGGELLGNPHLEQIEDALLGEMPDHTVVVIACDMHAQTITLFDPNSSHQQDQYSFTQFANAWSDSRNYLVTAFFTKH